MSLNFFKNEQPVKPMEKFGIIDPAQNKSNQKKYAYISDNVNDNWNTTVISKNQNDIFFNAIDGNINIYKSWTTLKEKQKSCDAMLHTNDTIIFLEIKDWKSIQYKHQEKITFWESATEQLENTIVHFVTAHPNKKFKKKYAYISNKNKPRFVFTNMTVQDMFKNNTNGFILKVSTTIDL